MIRNLIRCGEPASDAGWTPEIDAYPHTFKAGDPCFQRSHQSLFFAITGSGTPYFELVFMTHQDGTGCFVAYGQNNGFNGCDTAQNLPVTGQYELRGLHTGSNMWEFSYRYRSSPTGTWGAWTVVDRWNPGVSSVKRIFAESSAYVSSDGTLPERSTNFSGVQVRRASDSVWATANVLCGADVSGENIATDNDTLYTFDKVYAQTAGRARVVPGPGECI